jgi:hypothetical protein
MGSSSFARPWNGGVHVRGMGSRPRWHVRGMGSDVRGMGGRARAFRPAPLCRAVMCGTVALLRFCAVASKLLPSFSSPVVALRVDGVAMQTKGPGGRHSSGPDYRGQYAETC